MILMSDSCEDRNQSQGKSFLAKINEMDGGELKQYREWGEESITDGVRHRLQRFTVKYEKGNNPK